MPGGFGTHSCHQDGSDVAIKAIDLSILVGKGECPEDAGFEDEVQLLSKFRHPHLVTLLGWGHQGLGRYLVYEFLSGGDVFQRLHQCHCGQRSFPWHERLSVLLDAASGLSHMHNATPKAFHRDIKSANILLDRHGTAKLADFGLSCVSKHGATNITVKTVGGTPGYKCPLYERSRRCTESSEVYSFGMVMLEVLTGLDPSAKDASAPRGIVFPIAQTVAPNTPGALQRLLRSVDSTASWPRNLFEELAPLALQSVCCPDEERRPTFVELVRLLKSSVERFPGGCSLERVDVTQASACSDIDVSGGAVARAQSATQACPLRKPSSRCRLRPGCAAPNTKQPSPDEIHRSVSKASARDPAASFVLELLESVGCHPEELPVDQRWFALSPDDEGHLSAGVGRHLQGRLFEAWLPNPQRACISRIALEISWSIESADTAVLTSRGTNPLLVDGKLVSRGQTASLRIGSEIAFKYEMHVLLLFRFTALEDSLLTPQWSEKWSVQLTEEELRLAQRGGATALSGAHGLADAVVRLNSATGEASQFGAVTISSGSTHHLLYRKKQKEATLAQCGLGNGSCKNTAVQNVPAWTFAVEAGLPEASIPEDSALLLSCIQAEVLNTVQLTDLPSSLREVRLQHGRNFVGRHYQQHLFEALLRPLERLNVSGCHLCLDVSEHSALVTNLSSTLEFFVEKEHVPKDRSAQLQDGQVLSFAKRNGAEFSRLLDFQVKGRATARYNSRLGSVAADGAAESTADHAWHADGSSQPTARLSSQGLSTGKMLEGEAGKAHCGEVFAEDPGASTSPAVILELSGAGTKDLPVEKRRLGPMTLRKGPWIMGRRHQREFLQTVVKEECIDFVSRDHFAIAFEDDAFFLLALSQNRIWLDSSKTLSTRSLQRDEMQQLRPGDHILLGTSEAGTADSLRLCWRFKLAEPESIS
ncbi:BRL2 [Symbiodinium pilosum]|uniref:BRL2 protein n=1 Tax=Symbiodinium pilosum TaxID=2952 RepID=A0A812N9Q8_SYMPI|nr:BRL2 [Symbiodinium pilosum]